MATSMKGSQMEMKVIKRHKQNEGTCLVLYEEI